MTDSFEIINIKLYPKIEEREKKKEIWLDWEWRFCCISYGISIDNFIGNKSMSPFGKIAFQNWKGK